MGSPEPCPYPACALRLPGDGTGACACTLGKPVVACPSCLRANRAAARHCRECGADLPVPARQDLTGAWLKAAGSLGITGSFRRPPVLADGFLYAVSASGVVHQMSPRKGAGSQEIARFDLGSAGFNRTAVAHVSSRRSEVRGSLLLAASPGGVEAVSLADGRTHTLYKARFPEDLAVNRSEADSTGFKGVAVAADLFAFAVRSTPGTFALATKRFGDERPPEQVLLLDGTDVVGPALCGRWITLCTERQIGMYDRERGAASVMNLPRRFTPLLTPSSSDLNVPPGSLPLGMATLAGGERAACVAGTQDSQAGVLYVNFARSETTFEAIAKGSSFSTNRDGSACFTQIDETALLLCDEMRNVPTRTRPGTPAFYDEPYLCTFADTDLHARARLVVMRSGRRLELPFPEGDWRSLACCGAYVLEQEILVSYLDVAAEENGQGLRFAHFELAL